MRSRSSVRVALLASLLLLTAGCYTFQPLEPGPLEPGTMVRAHLANRDVQAPTGGLLLRDAVEGQVVHADDETLALQVIYRPESPIHPSRIGTLELAWTDVREVEQKRLNRTRTGFFVGTASVVGVAIVVRLFQEWAGGGSENGGGNGAEMAPSR